MAGITLGLPGAGCMGQNKRGKCCVKSFRVPNPKQPAQTIKEAASGALGKVDVSAPFKMEAEFQDGAGSNYYDFDCECRCCEFRQYIGGMASQNPDGGPLNPMREDGKTVEGGKIRPYGHRVGWKNIISDTYTPGARETGCKYQGHDAPGFRDQDPKAIQWADLDFVGEIYDACRDIVLVPYISTWKVKIRLNSKRP